MKRGGGLLSGWRGEVGLVAADGGELESGRGRCTFDGHTQNPLGNKVSYVGVRCREMRRRGGRKLSIGNDTGSWLVFGLGYCFGSRVSDRRSMSALTLARSLLSDTSASACGGSKHITNPVLAGATDVPNPGPLTFNTRSSSVTPFPLSSSVPHPPPLKRYVGVQRIDHS